MSAQSDKHVRPSSRIPKAVAAASGGYNLLFGVFLLLQLGVRGFTGTGGSDNALFQLIGYTSIAMLGFGVLSVFLAFRPSRGLILGLAAVLIAVGVLLFLFTLFIFGILDIALGFTLLIARRRMRP